MLIIAGAALLPPALAAAGQPGDFPEHLRARDRIVFYGDSITEQRLYSNYVENYLLLRYPKAGFTFFNAGWSGDQASGGLFRLERDLLVLEPTVVVICYGMNDGWYMKYTEEAGKYYSESMAGIVRGLKAKGIRPIILTCGITDAAWTDSVGYNDTLRKLADIAIRLAEEEQCPVFDLHKIMTEINARGKAQDASFSVVDEGTLGIHPQPPGQLVMAYGVLKAMGVPARIENVQAHGDVEEGGYNFKLNGLPFYIEPAARPILKYLPFDREFNQVRLRFPYIHRCPHRLQFAGTGRDYLLRYSDLAEGLDLTALDDSPIMRQAAFVHQFTKEKNDIYYKFWRTLGMKGSFWVKGPMDSDLQRIGIDASIRMEPVRRREIAPSENGYDLSLIPIMSAREDIGEGGSITTLSCLGPFPSDKPPLKNPRKFSAKPRRLSEGWQTAFLDGSKAANNLGGRFGKPKNSSVFLLTILESPVRQVVSCLAGSDDGFTLWLNGKLAGKSVSEGEFHPDSDKIEMKLKKGTNVLLVEVRNKKDNFGFALRLSGLSEPVTSVPPALARFVAESAKE